MPVTVGEALDLVSRGICRWVLRTTWTGGKTARNEEFNLQRGQPIDTALVEGDVWHGNPTLPLTMADNYLDIISNQVMRAVISGNDIIISRRWVSAVGNISWEELETITDGVDTHGRIFNQQRGVALDTVINDGESWQGNPTFPCTSGQPMSSIMANIMLRVIVEGDDIKMYELSQVT